MLTVSDKGGSDIKPVPAGVHRAVCIWIIDMGSSWSEMYQKWNHQILITWELPDERILVKTENGDEEDKPRVISKWYTPSLNEKAHLRADLVGWRTKEFTPEELAGFSLTNIAGKCCQLNVVQKTVSGGKTVSNVKAVVPAPKNMTITPENPIIIYDMDEHGTNIPEELPDWIKDKIKGSKEYQELINGGDDVPQETDTFVPEDDIPF